jgi:hypothetical protein
MFVLCAAVYLPSLAAFGFGRWGAFFTPPFYFQLSRFGLYLAWFGAGVWLGSSDLENGLLARDGALARHWRPWAWACFIAYNVLVFVPIGLAAIHLLGAYQRGAIEAVLWVASCVASGFAFLAIFRGTVRTRRPWMDSLSRSSYIIYLVHYVFVVWLQRAVMGVDVHASAKFLIVFAGALALSWLTAQGLLAVPWLRRVL